MLSAVTMKIIMSKNYQFPRMICENSCGSYLKKTLSNSTEDISYKLTALLWEPKWRSLSLSFFMADLEKRLLTASPFKPLVWKRFIDDIFSLWNIPNKEVSEFVNFANSFHQSIKFICEMSSERAVFLDTKVFKGPRHSTHKPLDLQTHFKPTEMFQYTHFSSRHPFNSKKGFIKGEALRLLRFNSVKENFETHKREFEQRLCQRGYPLTLVQKILTEVQFCDRKEALRNKTKQNKLKRFCRLLQLTIQPHRILKRFS